MCLKTQVWTRVGVRMVGPSDTALEVGGGKRRIRISLTPDTERRDGLISKFCFCKLSPI